MNTIDHNTIFVQRRSHIMPAYILLPFAYFAVFLPVYVLLVGDFALSLIHVLGALTVVLLSLDYLHNKCDGRTAFILSWLGTVIVLTGLYTGGLHNSGSFTLFAYIPFISFLQPFRQAIYWLAGTILAIATVLVLYLTDVIQLPYSKDFLSVCMANFVLASAITLIYVREKNISDQLAHQKTLEAKAVNRRLRKELRAKNQQTIELAHEKDKLAVESQKTEAIIAGIGEALSVSDRSGNIIKVNAAFERLLGYTASEVLHKNATSVFKVWTLDNIPIEPEDRAITNALKRRKAMQVHYIVQRKDGTKFVAQAFAMPYYYGRRLLGAINIVRDISEQYATDRAKTDFVSLVSHQLRTPLTALKWDLELLDDMQQHPSPVNQERSAKLMKNSAKATEHMIGLVNALLDVSKLELGVFDIHAEPLSPTELVQDCLNSYASALHDKQLSYSLKAPEQKLFITSDKKMLDIVIDNLLSNAIKYSYPHGAIAIDIQVTKQRLQLQVTDHGIGIPFAQRRKIFGKLFRTDVAIKSGEDGTGLGLYSVKQIVEKLGGSVIFRSSKKFGTTFTVTLPRTYQQPKPVTTSVAEKAVLAAQT